MTGHFRPSSNANLYCEGVSLEELARTYGTPLFVYSEQSVRDACTAYQKILRGTQTEIRYAVKANSNGAILRILKDMGCGFDVVSGGELERVLRLGVPADKVIFYGVGKTTEELEAAIQKGIGHIGVESAAEGERLVQVASSLNKSNKSNKPLKKQAGVLLRINPDVRPETHRHIRTGGGDDKFGIAADEVLAVAQQLKESPFLRLDGIGSHIGSQIRDLHPFVRSAENLRLAYDELANHGIFVPHLSLGGGFGISYQPGEEAFPLTDLPKILRVFDDWEHRRRVHFIIEPGRSLVAHAGILLTRVEYLKETKEKNFAIADAAMNDLPRPALYGAHHSVLRVSGEEREEAPREFDLVGPVCESADFLARSQRLNLRQGDLLAIEDCGAYAMSMASNYNSRPRAAEVLVRGDRHFLIRRRETLADLLAGEILPAE